jgi:hypothetical protein
VIRRDDDYRRIEAPGSSGRVQEASDNKIEIAQMPPVILAATRHPGAGEPSAVAPVRLEHEWRVGQRQMDQHERVGRRFTGQPHHLLLDVAIQRDPVPAVPA